MDLFSTGRKNRDRCKKTLLILKEVLRMSFQAKLQSADGKFSLAWQIWQSRHQTGSILSSPRNKCVSSKLHISTTNAHSRKHTLTRTMLHAKASVEKGEYQLSIKYMLSFPDAVRLQVINFTYERFPITSACAPLITTHQQGRGKPQNSYSTLTGNTTKRIYNWLWSQDINLWGTWLTSAQRWSRFCVLKLWLWH